MPENNVLNLRCMRASNLLHVNRQSQLKPAHDMLKHSRDVHDETMYVSERNRQVTCRWDAHAVVHVCKQTSARDTKKDFLKHYTVLLPHASFHAA